MKRLALAMAAGGCCACGQAADITISITSAVHLSWQTTTNRAYQVQVSTNLPGDWMPIGPLIEGTGETVGEFFPATNSSRFYNVQETIASGTAWLDGNWEGRVCQMYEGVLPDEFIAHLTMNSSTRLFAAAYASGGETCSANLSLRAYSDFHAEFHETIQNGACAESTIYLTRINQTTIAYNFITTNPSVSGGGFLSKR